MDHRLLRATNWCGTTSLAQVLNLILTIGRMRFEVLDGVNNELQTYVNGEHNGRCVTEIKDGTLRITAFKEGVNVYSGRVYANVNKGWRTTAKI